MLLCLPLLSILLLIKVSIGVNGSNLLVCGTLDISKALLQVLWRLQVYPVPCKSAKRLNGQIHVKIMNAKNEDTHSFSLISASKELQCLPFDFKVTLFYQLWSEIQPPVLNLHHFGKIAQSSKFSVSPHNVSEKGIISSYIITLGRK